MICPRCGHENPDDAEFCEQCPEYLWRDRDGDGAQARQSVAVVNEPAETAADAAPAEAAQGSASAADERLTAVPPGHEFEPPPPPVRRPVVAPEPGELICDQCGTGNRAEANFCRRCGASLAQARVAARPPWWRRLLDGRRRTYVAGERRRGSRAVAKTGMQKARRGVFEVSRALGLLALVGIVSVAAVRGDAVNRAREEAHDLRVILFPHYEPVVPASATATSHLPGHGPLNAFDGNLATSWAEGVPGDGRGQKLVAHFGREVDIARVGITLGDSNKPTQFANLLVPHRLRLRLFDRRGTLVAGKVLFLNQKPDFQRFSIDASNATRAVITILQDFPSRGRHATSITEVEYFDKQ
jgi:ribosomal protein L40E